MSILQLPLDYSDRDFDSLRLRLQGLIRSVFPDWTDYNVATFGNIMLEMFSYVGDTVHFYQDNQAAESFWPTLTQRISAIRLGRLTDFELPSATSSSGDLTISMSSAATKKVTIAVGHRFRTSSPENPVRFQATAAGEISVGATSGSFQVEQSERRYEEFDSSEEPNEEITLTGTPYLDDSCATVVRNADATLRYGVAAGNGDYTQVDTFLGYTSVDRVFVVLVDHNDQAHLQFSNGVTGAIPQGRIEVGYKVGGGIEGNVDASQITISEDPISYEDGQAAPVTVTNLTAMTGGADRMTVDQARAQAPASLRQLTRSVTKEDFETAAKDITGVARALMATSNEYANIQENTGILNIVAQGNQLSSGRIEPATPSTSLLAEIEEHINTNKPPTITFTYEVQAAPFETMNISTRIYLAQGADETTVGDAVRETVKDFFAAQLSTGVANPDIDFGANVKSAAGSTVPELIWSKLFGKIEAVTNVRKVDEGTQGLLINGLRQSPSISPLGFPKLGTTTVINGDTGSAI